MRIENWSDYDNPPGAGYAVTLISPEGGKATSSGMSIIRQNLDARPAVDVHSIERTSNGGARVVVKVFKSGTLGGILGAYHNDGSRFWQISEVDRIDSGANRVTATIGRVLDSITDPFDRYAEEAKRTGVETTQTVARIGVPTVALAGLGWLAFLWVAR